MMFSQLTREVIKITILIEPRWPLEIRRPNIEEETWTRWEYQISDDTMGAQLLRALRSIKKISLNRCPTLWSVTIICPVHGSYMTTVGREVNIKTNFHIIIPYISSLRKV